MIRALLPLVLLSACRTGSLVTSPQPERVDPAVAAAREALRREASIDASTVPERAIAVPPLVVRTADTTLTPLGYGLADMLMTDLARSSQLAVVDRSHMDAMLRELQMARAGQVDSTQAPRVGRLLGARRLVVGALYDRGNGEFGIDTRVANTLDGSLAGALSARAPLASIFDAEKALAYRLFDQLGVTLTPEERAAIEQRPTSNVTAMLAYSRGVRDEAFGQYASANANYQAALAADPSFNAARVRMTSMPATETTTSASSSGGVSGATALAGGAINPSPVATVGTTASANATQQQTSQQDRGSAAQKQPAYTTVIINVKQLP
ncbi:MAG: CsgG/HfaB family protein [Gemmatimonadota bacterium]|nr:CsgG/HfaB family protein [Gemmatimonadota bacterium]